MKSVLMIAKNEIASGIRYLMSALAEKSIKANMVIYSHDAEGNFKQLCGLIDELNVGIIGISVFSSERKDYEAITRSVKNKYPHISVVCGGPDVNSNPGPCLEWADYVCISDGEIAFPNLCTAVLQNKDLGKIDLPNIYFKSNGQLIKSRLIAEEDLDHYPYPFFSDENVFLINSGKIQKYKDSTSNNYNIYASRGCPFQCSYCSNHVFNRNSPIKRYYRSRSVSSVIGELEAIKLRFPGIKFISFHDEQFGNDNAWVNKFVNEYKERINLPYFLQMNPKNYNESIVKELKESGLYRTSFGVQSGASRIRSIYRRPESLEQIISANRILNKMWISHFFDIIVDNPYEGMEDYIETLKFILKLKKPFVVKTFDLIHLPETDLTLQLLKDKKISEDEIEGNYRYRREISWRPTHRNLSTDLNCRYIISLMHLSGNILIPNFVIEALLAANKITPKWFKRCFVTILLTENYNSLIMLFTNFVFMIKSKGIFFAFKKLIAKLWKRVR